MRMKDVVSLSDERTEDKTLPYIALENIESWTSNFIPTEAETVGLNSKFCCGDVLFGKLRPYLAKGYITQYDGICSTEFFVMHPHKSVRSKYLLYWELSHNVIDFLKNQVAGVKMPRTTWYDFSNQQIYLPSLPEQDRIVAYLDEKTSAIDSQVSLLEQKAKKYELLKKSLISHAVTRGLGKDVRLKESGIDWIGQIPEDWSIVEIKHYCRSIFAGATPSTKEASYWDGDIPWLPSGACHDGIITEFNHTITEEGFANSSTKMIPANTMLMAMTGATCANTGYLTFESCANQSVCAYIENKKICKSKYLFYLLQAARKYILTFQTGGAQAGINLQDCSLLKVPCVPLSEQQAIADYLDKKTAEIDAAIANINQQIEKYKLLRRALINEVVTGQRAI